jgi:hypothetical protein
MAILGAKWGCIATLYQGTELRLFLFAPHEQTLGAIRSACEDFQRRLLHWKETGAVDFYPPQSSKDADRMYPQSEPESIVYLDDSAQELAMKILAAKVRIDQAEADRAEAEKKLKILIGDANKAVAGNYLVSWPMRQYKAVPAKTVPAKEAYSIRQSTLSIKEIRP